MDARAASQLFHAAAGGSRELLGVLEGNPVLVVEIGSGEDVAGPVPAWLPCVVLAVADGAPGVPAPAGVDLAVCPAGPGMVPAGWVAAEDATSEVRRLAEAVDRWPQPAVVLAQLLRTTLALEPDAALGAESLAYSTLQAGPAFASWLATRRDAAPRQREEPDPPVIVERHGNELTVTLHRPAVRNAVNARLRDALAEALQVAASDPSITSVALRGAGPAFSSGGDLDEFGTAPDPASAHLARTARSPARLLAGMASRLTAYLHGPCVGAGIELAAFAGTVRATRDTTVQLPELSLGLVPGSGGTVSIPRRIGRHRTAWLGLGGSALDVETALAWGLVDGLDE